MRRCKRDSASSIRPTLVYFQPRIGPYGSFLPVEMMAGFWRGLYAGVGPTVLKGGVNNCIRFSAFNEMKHLYQEYKGALSTLSSLSLC